MPEVPDWTFTGSQSLPVAEIISRHMFVMGYSAITKGFEVFSSILGGGATRTGLS